VERRQIMLLLAGHNLPFVAIFLYAELRTALNGVERHGTRNAVIRRTSDDARLIGDGEAEERRSVFQ
jgi:hypothetical protein